MMTYYQKNLEKCLAASRAQYQRLKNDPEYRAKKAAAAKRCNKKRLTEDTRRYWYLRRNGSRLDEKEAELISLLAKYVTKSVGIMERIDKFYKYTGR